MRTLLYIFSVRNAIKRKKNLFSLKRSATCAMAKNNLLKRFAISARAKVAQLALCALNCGMPTSANQTCEQGNCVAKVCCFSNPNSYHKYHNRPEGAMGNVTFRRCKDILRRDQYIHVLSTSAWV